MTPRTRWWPAVPWDVLLAGVVLLVLLVAVVCPQWLAAFPPDQVDPVQAFRPPGAAHLLGTDQLGRDVLSRVVHGARPALLAGLGATALATIAGGTLGLVAATAGRVVDELLMRGTDVLLAFPGLLLALLVVAVSGPGSIGAAVAIGLAVTPGFIRLARAQAMAIRQADYVRAALVLGHGPWRVLVRHVLPNAVPPLLALATVNIGSALAAGSALGFLGLGAQPPSPEWGSMLAESRDFLDVAWTGAAAPGLAITTTVLAFTVLGARLRRRLERGEPTPVRVRRMPVRSRPGRPAKDTGEREAA